MTTPTWGATPAEWAHFADTLRLAEDLLPVVSNPHAKIAQLSKMKDLGKVPSQYHRKTGEVIGIAAWPQQITNDKQIARWSVQADLGICVQTRRVRAIDIDIDDPVQAQVVLDMVDQVLGELPRRFRADSGKCLLMIDMPGEFNKRVLRTKHGAIEFLANGQQFVACGTHPKGQRYQWDGSLPGVPPVVTPAEFEALWAGLAKALGSVDEQARRGVLPSIPRTANQAWGDSMVPWLGENGWVEEYDRDGRVHIRCPWKDEHTTDTGPSSTTYFPAGVGGFQQGHFRCLHAHCTGRVDQDFLDAMGLTIASEFEAAEEIRLPTLPGEGESGATGLLDGAVPGFEDQGPWPPLVRKKTKTGGSTIEPTANNARLVMMRPDICRVRLCYDAFKDHVMVAQPGDQAWRPIKDTDYFTIRCELERVGFEKPGKDLARDSALWVAEHFKIDSAISWARGLRWDGVRRIETFFPRYLRTLDTPYTRAVGLYMWTALAGRALVPGVKADMVPVMVSHQGTAKTQVVEALAPVEDAFVEIDLSKNDDALARAMRGKMVAEIAELRGLQGRDAESNKAFITRRFEEWAPKYIEYSQKMPRRLLFIGTSNKEFLDDETGERRWLPLHVGQANIEQLKADVGQLWAEGVERFDAGGVAWQAAEELARGEHAAFKVSDPWEEPVALWLEQDVMDGAEGEPRGDGLVAVCDVLSSALGVAKKDQDRRHEMRIAKILGRLGYKKKAVKIGRSGLSRWIRLDGPKAWRLSQ